MKSFDVFLSYSHIDQYWTAKLKKDLLQYKVKVWLDSDEIRPGDAIVNSLERAIPNCRAVALIVSPESIKSKWVEDEYSHALHISNSQQSSLQVIPVILRDAELPGFLSNRRWVDFRDEASYSKSVYELVWGITDERPNNVIELSSPTPLKTELTICFIGKTGSGKSTLINAFYNWCLGIDGVEKKDRKYCITTRTLGGEIKEAQEQFAHLNTENLDRGRGASATVFASRYTFVTDHVIFHIVDTPGFADTSGVERDRQHMQEILEHITRLNQVNVFGIVWNEKRLTAEQKFVVGCLKGLLPKDRHNNLVVCVTNTLMLDPDTEDAIQEAGLDQCPIICFDNLWVIAEWNRVSVMYRREAETSFLELANCAMTAEPISSSIFESISRKRKQLENDRIDIFTQIKTLDNHKKALKKVIRELDDLSKDIKNIKIKREKISAKETPAAWNTFCQICLNNCHIGCGLSYKTGDLSSCASMDKNGNCEKCNHRYTVHTHECTRMERQEIKEEITDNENLLKKQSMEQDKANREKIKQDLNNKIHNLDIQIEKQVKELRLIVDDLSNLVMAPFNPYYLEYLDELKEGAKANGDVEIAISIEMEMQSYLSFIGLVKSGVNRVQTISTGFLNRLKGTSQW